MSWPRVFSLIACNLIWAVQPVFGKLMLREVTPLQVAWLRYAVAAGVYLLLAAGLRVTRPATSLFFRPRTQADWVPLLFIGLVPFALAPVLQTSGLAASQAVDSVLIVAMEPVIAVALAWIFLRERLDPWLALCLAVSTAGFGLLSVTGFPAAGMGGAATWTKWQANLLILLSVASEGVYSIAGRRLMNAGRPPLAVFGSGILLGAVVLTVILVASDGLPPFTEMSFTAWSGAFWMGALGTTLGYGWWLKLLQEEKVGTLSVSIFLQPVAGSIAGILFLGENLDFLQWLGAALILTGVVASTRLDANIRQ